MTTNHHRVRKRLEGFEEALAKADLTLDNCEFYNGGSAPAEGPRNDRSCAEPQPHIDAPYYSYDNLLGAGGLSCIACNKKNPSKIEGRLQRRGNCLMACRANLPPWMPAAVNRVTVPQGSRLRAAAGDAIEPTPTLQRETLLRLNPEPKTNVHPRRPDGQPDRRSADDDRIEIVDVGASNVSDKELPSYDALLDQNLARLTAFEPNPAELARLTPTDSRRYFPTPLAQVKPCPSTSPKVPAFFHPPAQRGSESRNPFLWRADRRAIGKSMATHRIDDLAEITA